MGAKLARTFLDRGLKVTVWNRTASRADALVAAGAVLARSPADAIAASPLTVICTLNKAATLSILEMPGVAEALKGHALVDLSTGLASEARANGDRVIKAGGGFLDGGIMEYPRAVGSKSAVFLYSGKATTFRQHEATLALLAGDQRYLGEDPGAAMTTYMALWTYYFVSLTGFLEGAALAQTAGLDLEHFRSLATSMNPKLNDEISDAMRRIKAHDYAGDQAPVDVYFDGLELIRDTQKANKLGHLGVDAFIGYMEAAKKAGDGGNDIATLFRALGGRD
jgi:3-hydroxyisobutyrate dehydrogenase-like beta-hydroxyacid dehydrogenase